MTKQNTLKVHKDAEEANQTDVSTKQVSRAVLDKLCGTFGCCLPDGENLFRSLWQKEGEGEVEWRNASGLRRQMCWWRWSEIMTGCWRTLTKPDHLHNEHNNTVHNRPQSFFLHIHMETSTGAHRSIFLQTRLSFVWLIQSMKRRGLFGVCITRSDDLDDDVELLRASRHQQRRMTMAEFVFLCWYRYTGTTFVRSDEPLGSHRRFMLSQSAISVAVVLLCVFVIWVVLTHVEHVHLFVCCRSFAMLNSQHQGFRVSVICRSHWLNVDVISQLCRHLLCICRSYAEHDDQTDDYKTNLNSLWTADIRYECDNIWLTTNRVVVKHVLQPVDETWYTRFGAWQHNVWKWWRRRSSNLVEIIWMTSGCGKHRRSESQSAWRAWSRWSDSITRCGESVRHCETCHKWIDTRSVLLVQPFNGDTTKNIGWKRSFSVAVRAISREWSDALRMVEDSVTYDFVSHRQSERHTQTVQKHCTLCSALLCKDE